MFTGIAAKPLSKAEFDCIVAQMDRGDFEFDPQTRARLLSLWNTDPSAVPYPSRFSEVYGSGDAYAMNSLEMMELSYRLPYSLAYEQQQHNAYANLVNLAISNGVNVHGARIADVGCGFGGLLTVIRDIAQPSQLHGIECAYSALDWIRAHRPYISPVFGNLSLQADDFMRHCPYPLDVVFCTAVLEHLEDPQRALANLIALAAKGTVVVSVPNGRPDTADQHINFWSPESWRAFIRLAARDLPHTIAVCKNRLSPGGIENVAIIRCQA